MTEYIGIKDKQLISLDGKVLQDEIEGLIIHRTPPIEDERGEVVEVFRSSWNISTEPMVYAYAVTIRPQAIKGWVFHKLQDDRIFVNRGVQLWAFFDNRENSPTYKNFMKVTVSERNRAMIIIPKGVYHAVKNIGTEEAQFINFPTMPYNRASPDKYRLQLKNDLIPFDFTNDGQ
jgi:dTDP-4-dehydrorhamnose 3,5-epimerase